MNLTYRSEGEVRGSIRRREGNALRNIHRCSFFHKSPDRLHIDQIYRNIIPMWKKQKKSPCWIIYLRSFLKSGIFLPALVLLHGGCAAGMLVIGCNLKRGSLLLKAILTLYFAAFLCGGFWEVIVSDKLTVKMFLILAAATWSGITALSYLMDSMRIRTKNIYPITIFYSGKGYSFYDSVNGKPVSVGTEKVLSEICSEETVSCLKHLKENPGESGKPGTAGLHPHFTFFHSIGKEQGMMLAVTFERLCIQTPAEVVCIDNPVFAFSFETSAFGKEYEVLLNSRLL